MNLEEFKGSEEYTALVADMEAKVLSERERCFSIMSIEGGHEDIKSEAIKNGSKANDVYASLYKAEIAAKKDESARLTEATQPVVTAEEAPKKTTSVASASDFLAKRGNVSSQT